MGVKAVRPISVKDIMAKDNKSNAGRPTDYKEEYNKLAENYSLLGATDKVMAGYFGVSEVTLNAWKKKHPEFLKSLKRGKEEADANVSNALYNRALGYSHPDTKFASFEGQITDEKEYTKHLPPDTTACIFWLKNRQRETWKDKHEVEHSGGATVTLTAPDKFENTKEWEAYQKKQG